MSLLKVLHLPPLPAKAAVPASAKSAADGKAAATTAPKKTEKLHEASDGWRQTHRQASERIAALKAAAQAHYAKEHPEIVREIDKGLAKLDDLLEPQDSASAVFETSRDRRNRASTRVGSSRRPVSGFVHGQGARDETQC